MVQARPCHIRPVGAAWCDCSWVWGPRTMTNRRTGKKLTRRCGPAAQTGTSLPEVLPESAPLQKGVMTEEEAFMSMWVTFQGDRWGNGCSPWSPDVLRVLDPFVPGLAPALLVSVLEEPVDPLPRLQQMVREHDYKALGAFRPEGSPHVHCGRVLCRTW